MKKLNLAFLLIVLSVAQAARAYVIQQSTTAYPLVFFMADAADHVTGKTGLTCTVTLSKAGGSFASPSGAVTEIGNGWYKVAGNATDSGTLGPLLLHATASGADPADASYEVVAFNPQDSVRIGITALPNAAAEASGGLYTRGTGAGQIKQTNNGEIDSNSTHVNNVATTSVTAINANLGTTQPINFTGTGASALAKSDTVDVGGSAVKQTGGYVHSVPGGFTSVVTIATTDNLKTIVEAASSGTLCVLMPGTHTITSGQLVTVPAGVKIWAPGGPSLTTVIQPTNIGPQTGLFKLSDNSEISNFRILLTSLDGLTASNGAILQAIGVNARATKIVGYSPNDGPMLFTNPSSLICEDCELTGALDLIILSTNCTCSYRGGYLRSTGSEPYMSCALLNAASSALYLYDTRLIVDYTGNQGDIDGDPGSSYVSPLRQLAGKTYAYNTTFILIGGTALTGPVTINANAGNVYLSNCRYDRSKVNGSSRITEYNDPFDMRNVIKATSPDTWTNITVPSVTTAGSVTGNVGGNVTGTVGSVIGAVGSVTGNVGGNVAGSVGSIASGGIAASSFAAGAIDKSKSTGWNDIAAGTAMALTSGERNSTADAWIARSIGSPSSGTLGKALADSSSAGNPWSALTASNNDAGSFGALFNTNIDAKISEAGGGASDIRIKKNTPFPNFTFYMKNASGNPVTGSTITAQRTIDGGAFANCTNSATEIGSGAYKIDLSAADLNGDDVMFKFTGTGGAKPTMIKIVTQQ